MRFAHRSCKSSRPSRVTIPSRKTLGFACLLFVKGGLQPPAVKAQDKRRPWAGLPAPPRVLRP